MLCKSVILLFSITTSLSTDVGALHNTLVQKARQNQMMIDLFFSLLPMLLTPELIFLLFYDQIVLEGRQQCRMADFGRYLLKIFTILNTVNCKKKKNRSLKEERGLMDCIRQQNRPSILMITTCKTQGFFRILFLHLFFIVLLYF